MFSVIINYYPEHREIVTKNFNDFLKIENLSEWLTKIHVKGRFEQSWKKI